jgi:hypothetical protein
LGASTGSEIELLEAMDKSTRPIAVEEMPSLPGVVDEEDKRSSNDRPMENSALIRSE